MRKNVLTFIAIQAFLFNVSVFSKYLNSSSKAAI